MPASSLGASELTPLDRAYAHGMSIAGMGVRQIARHFKVNPSTISRSMKAYDDKNDYKSAPRGRPRKTTSKVDKKLCKKACADYTSRRQPSGELNRNIVPKISRRTVQRRLKEKNIRKWQAAERPLLEDNLHALDRHLDQHYLLHML